MLLGRVFRQRVFTSLYKDGHRNYITKHGFSGTWEKTQYNGETVVSFIPKDLPPKIDMKFPHPLLGTSLQANLQEADENLQELRQYCKQLPVSLMNAFLKKEAISSCQIELNSSALADVMRQTCGFPPPKIRSKNDITEFNEVLQYIEAMQLGTRLLQIEPLSVDFLETLHTTVTAETLGQNYAAEAVPGKIRTSMVALGPVTPPYTNTFFPPAPKHVRRLLDNLVHFMDAPSDMHPILKIGIEHAQFETIFPFVHGNGQMNRVILMLRLMKYGLIEKNSLYPSYAFKVCRWLYLNCLHCGAWEIWLHFFVGSISHAARDAIELCNDFIAVRTRHLAALKGNNRRDDIDQRKLEKLLDMSYRMPYLQKQTVALLFGEDYSVAHELLDLFTRRGILEIVRDHRNEIWYHNKSIEDELNKERHIASYASMLGDWMRVPARETLEINETVHYNYNYSSSSPNSTASSYSSLHESVSATRT